MIYQMTTYTRGLDIDFLNSLNPQQLKNEINKSSISKECISVINIQNDVSINFIDEINDIEKTELDTIIGQHIPLTNAPGPTYDVIVDSNGNGDYLLPSDAFADGHVTVYLRNGIYFETKDVVIPDYGSIYGESGGNVVIYFSGSNSIIIDATNGINEKIGTINVVNNSNIVSGTDTTFTNLSPGNYILIKANYHKIMSITDDTHLIIESNYMGVPISGLKYMAQNMYTGIHLENIIVAGSTSYGIFIRGCRHYTLMCIAIRKNAKNLYIADSGDNGSRCILIDSGNGDGLTLHNCVSMSFVSIDVYNNNGCGIRIEEFSESITFTTCKTSNNNGDGFNISDESIDVVMNMGVVKLNSGNGIKINSGANGTMISNCSVHNNGGSGIHTNGSDCIINGNRFSGNNTGITIIGGLDNIVSLNNLKNNTVPLDDSGTDTLKSNNKT
jgi:hypothetical protein